MRKGILLVIAFVASACCEPGDQLDAAAPQVDGGVEGLCGQLGQECCIGEACVDGECMPVGVCNCTALDGGGCIVTGCESGICVAGPTPAPDAAPAAPDAYAPCGTLGLGCCPGEVCYAPYTCTGEVCE